MLFSYDVDIFPKVRLIGRIKYTEPWIHFSRIIDEYVLYIIEDGDMYLAENGVQYHLKKGDFFLLEPNVLHEGYQKATCDYYYIHFTHPSLKGIPAEQEHSAVMEMIEKRRISLASYNLDVGEVTDSIALFRKQCPLPNHQEYKALLNKAIDVYNRREEHYKRVASVELHRLLLNVAHEFVVTQAAATEMHITKSEVIAEQILNFLNENYTTKINSKLIEERFEVNFDYINRVFSKMTGYTIFHYLNAVRMNHAKELISTTSLQFHEIAYLIGIDDRFYFSKLFKKHTGMTPSAYFEYVNKTNRKSDE